MSPVPMQPFSPMGYMPFNATHTMQPYTIGNYGMPTPAAATCIVGSHSMP